MASPFLFLAAGIIPGGPELIVILFIVVLLFGATKLPSLARGMGQSIKEFKKAAKEDSDESESEAKKPADSGKSSGPN